MAGCESTSARPPPPPHSLCGHQGDGVLQATVTLGQDGLDHQVGVAAAGKEGGGQATNEQADSQAGIGLGAQQPEVRTALRLTIPQAAPPAVPHQSGWLGPSPTLPCTQPSGTASPVVDEPRDVACAQGVEHQVLAVVRGVVGQGGQPHAVGGAGGGVSVHQNEVVKRKQVGVLLTAQLLEQREGSREGRGWPEVSAGGRSVGARQFNSSSDRAERCRLYGWG